MLELIEGDVISVGVVKPTLLAAVLPAASTILDLANASDESLVPSAGPVPKVIVNLLASPLEALTAATL